MRILVVAVLACLTTRASATAADLEANKLLVRSYIEEMWNKHQPSAADRLVATDFIEHNPRLPQGLAGTAWRSIMFGLAHSFSGQALLVFSRLAWVLVRSRL